jgi:hypothetical protein
MPTTQRGSSSKIINATSAEAPAHDYLSRRIDPMHLKHRLRDAQSDRRNRFHRGYLFRLALR